MARQNKIPRKTKAPRDSVTNFAASSTAPTERPAPVEIASKPPRLVDKAEVLGRITCACRKSNPNILVVQPAQDRAAKNGPGQFDGARDRRILLQR
jgi:hypothetical protein